MLHGLIIIICIVDQMEVNVQLVKYALGQVGKKKIPSATNILTVIPTFSQQQEVTVLVFMLTPMNSFISEIFWFPAAFYYSCLSVSLTANSILSIVNNSENRVLLKIYWSRSTKLFQYSPLTLPKHFHYHLNQLSPDYSTESTKNSSRIAQCFQLNVFDDDTCKSSSPTLWMYKKFNFRSGISSCLFLYPYNGLQSQWYE